MGKSYFFFGTVRTHPEDETRISTGADYSVCGGSKTEHEKVVEIVQEVRKEFRKDPPQTSGEERMILLDVLKKIG